MKKETKKCLICRSNVDWFTLITGILAFVCLGYMTYLSASSDWAMLTSIYLGSYITFNFLPYVRK